ncbi:MAG: zinc ribbon domain-containing protein [Candidatus Coatesbacteria bacterium]|nr:zinc ribbon domain-containing protein [Candidatus Coatesbacteria bacterium]
MPRYIPVFIIIILFFTSLLAIKCPNCGHENPDDSSFCTECGAALKKSSNTSSGTSRYTSSYSSSDILFGPSIGIAQTKWTLTHTFTYQDGTPENERKWTDYSGDTSKSDMYIGGEFIYGGLRQGIGAKAHLSILLHDETNLAVGGIVNYTINAGSVFPWFGAGIDLLNGKIEETDDESKTFLLLGFSGGINIPISGSKMVIMPSLKYDFLCISGSTTTRSFTAANRYTVTEEFKTKANLLQVGCGLGFRF